MSTSQQFLVYDNSTAANYKAWASALSNFIRSAGWTNSTDTGQLNGAGGNNWAGVSTVPGSGLFYYEMFQPGDALTGFFLKVEYGNSSGSTNSPTVRITAGTTTNGAGTLTGFFTTATLIMGSVVAPTSTVTTYECDFSGTNNRLSILLWRNGPAPQCLAVQRSLNGSGSPTGTYVTIWTGGTNFSGAVGNGGYQQSLYFSVGAAPVLPNRIQSNPPAGWACLGPNFTLATSSAFNGGIPISNAQPCVGVWDYPCTVVGVAATQDIAEGVPFTITNQYGQSVTYMPTKLAPLSGVSNVGAAVACCMEYD